jgi:hypothetical protein
MFEEDKNIKELNNALVSLKDDTPLIPDRIKYNNLLTACINIVKQNNYAVIMKPKGSEKVKTTRDLVDLYYYLLQFNLGKVTPCRDDMIDLSIAKRFVKKIKDSTKLEYHDALAKCVEIVEGLFKYHNELNLNPQTFTSFKLFGQDKLGWITERILSLINDELYDDSDWINRVDASSEVYAEKNNIEFGFPDLEELANEIRRKNGKKENS